MDAIRKADSLIKLLRKGALLKVTVTMPVSSVGYVNRLKRLPFAAKRYGLLYHNHVPLCHSSLENTFSCAH